ncbi:MAG: translocation/assembly module TamB domain-containing protein [Bacteroidota bacterium]|nr:translocation/assembly module TamB domain-containing protein [Bacteroidota bacterium]
MRKAFKFTGKIVLWALTLLFVLFIILILLVRLPSVQNYITHIAIDYVTSKTHTKIQLERLYIGFPKSIVLEGLFAEDLNHDTLVYIEQLDMDINIPALLKNKLEVNNLLLNKLNVSIKRSLPDSSFNFDFLINAFSNKTVKPANDASGIPWTIRVHKIGFQNLLAGFNDEVSGTMVYCMAREIQIIPEKIDLNSRQLIFKKLFIDETDIQIAVKNVTAQTKNIKSEARDWQFLAGQISLNKVGFKFDMGNNPRLVKGLDYNHLLFTDVELEVTDAFYEPKKIFANIEHFSFQEQSGLNLVQLKSKIVLVNRNKSDQLTDLFVNKLSIRMEQATSVSLDAHIKGLDNIKTAVYDIRLKTLSTKKQDLLKWIPQKKLPVSVPSNMTLSGHLKGSLIDFITEMHMRSSSGSLNFTAAIKITSLDTFYKANIQTRDLNLGYLLNQPSKIGTISLNANIKGKNFSSARIKAKLTAKVSDVAFNKYRYHHISLRAHSDKGKIETLLLVNDKNLRLQLQGSMSVIAKHESVFMNLNLEGADLKKLKITNENIRSSGKLSIDLKGKSIEEMSGRISLHEIIIIRNDKKYRMDSFLVATVNDKKHSLFKMKSGIINIDYEGSVTLLHLNAALTHHVSQYFRLAKDTMISNAFKPEQDFKLVVQIAPHPILNEVVLVGLEKFSGATLEADFSTNRQQLNLILKAPLVQYKGKLITGINLEVHSNNRNLNYAFSIASLKSGNIQLPDTKFSGKLENNMLHFSLDIIHKDSGNKLYIAGNLKQEAGRKYTLHIDQNLVFNNMKWQLTPDNHIRFINGGIYIQHFELSNQHQSISMSSEGSNETAPLNIAFRKFEIATLSQIAEKDTAIIRGEINGTLELRNLQKSPAFVSSLNISNIVYMENPIGNLSIEADNLSAGQEGKYAAHILLSGFENKAAIKGTYFANDNKRLDFNVDIERLNLKSIEGFTAGQIRQSSGYLSGKIHIGGSGSKPVINGNIGFRDAAFNIAYINNNFTLKDEHLKLDPDGIYFRSFTILDAYGQKAIIEGAVYTRDFNKMKFDLTIKTNKFTVMNTSLRDNPLYFGKVLMSSTIRIKGNESLPVIHANAKLLAGTQLTMLVPSSQLSTDKGEGIVIFTDTHATDHIMREIDTLLTQNVFKGIDLTANIEINRETTLKLIVDRVSGDSLVVRGDGILSFSIDPGGKQSLTGTYNLNSGSYHTTFQKVIKRNFKIKPGSSITWSGSVIDATLDITAIYRIRTAPADLLSNELSGSLLAERNAYRKPMYFEVNMIMKGALMKPEISFMLDMDDRDKNSFGGTVYTKVNSLNNNPAELNKQVFSLLVLNKFVPAGAASDPGESNAVNTMARNSVNQILSDQLNQISGKYIKDVELNFDIKSNDQYTETSVKQNTEVQVGLKKEFLNKRMSVQVGSNINVQDNGSTTTNASNLTGDMVLEYKITEDGRYRFKAFRENQYAGIIDGLLYKTGIGIIYIRDYDTLKELFSKPGEEMRDER